MSSKKTAGLPRKSAANTKRALRILAVGKYLDSLIKQSMGQAKAYLGEKELSVKDRRTVTLDDGTDIGTVSLVAGRQGAPQIVDPIALAAWCDEHGIEHGGKPSVEFPGWFTAKANLESVIARAKGEMPDGLAPGKDGSPYVMIRQTSTQAIDLRDAINASQADALLAEIAPLQIGDGK